jgi:hypothetical protein
MTIPRSPILSNLNLNRRCFFSPPKPKNRHFDRSCSRFCEQRSGEIRFSTSIASPSILHSNDRGDATSFRPIPKLKAQEDIPPRTLTHPPTLRKQSYAIELTSQSLRAERPCKGS